MFKIMRAWDKGKNKVAYVYRDHETGNVKIGEVRFQNWFYVKKDDFENNTSFFKKLKSDNVIVDYERVHKFYKIYVDVIHSSELLNKDMEWVWEYKSFVQNKLMSDLKMLGIPTYEADVNSFKRWMLSQEVEIETDYKILYYDIETDDRHADGLTPGKYRILSCAFKSSDTMGTDGKLSWICLEDDSDEAEQALLDKLAKAINAHDVIISFNGMNFDDPYIKSRFLRYGIQVDWRKKFLQDQCWAYRKYGPNLTSYSLDNIAKNVLERGKVEHAGMRIWDMWEKDRDLLKVYNCEDVQLMYDIEKATGFLEAHRDICAAGLCPVDDLYVSRKIDNFILKQAQEDNEYHFKTMVYSEGGNEEKVTYEGAFVFDPIIDRHTNIRVLDFSSLYPNVINTFNISPDTLIEFGDKVPEDKIITTPAKHKYRKDFIGILPKVVMRLASKRKYYKDLMAKEIHGTFQHKLYDRMQYLYKYFGLSFYGCMGEKHSRVYDVRVAESITLTGQYFTKACADYIERHGMTVVAGDSITGERNTVILKDGLIEIISFEKLYHKVGSVTEDRGKEIGRFESPVFTLSYNFQSRQSEWKEIKCVIRHKADKPVVIYRNRDGDTRVTTDHSLIDKDGNCFAPCVDKDAFTIPALANHTLAEFDLREYIEDLRMFDNGLYTICTKINQENIEALLRLCAGYLTKEPQLLQDLIDAILLNKDGPSFRLLKSDWGKILPLYTLELEDFSKNEKITSMRFSLVWLGHLCGKAEYEKKIPNFVYNLSPALQVFFIEEMMKAGGRRKKNGNGFSYEFESESINVISGLTYLLKLNGHSVGCGLRLDKGTYRLRTRKSDQGGNQLQNQVIESDYDGYVYDLSVEGNNNFVDAMGNLLLHNTDSVFIKGIPSNNQVLKVASKLTELCEAHALRKFNCDICTIAMDYDKGFKTYLPIAKKRYAGVLDYLDGHDISDFNMYIAGLEYKRTDVTKIVKELQWDLLKMILEDEDAPLVDVVRTFILSAKERVFSGKLEIEDITLAQKLTKEVELYEGRQMHVIVAREMQRDGKEVWVGDKIPYFIIGVGQDGKPIPVPLYKFKGRYSESYYWNNKIFPALQRILEVVYKHIDWENYKCKGSKEVKVGRMNLW